MGRVVEPLSRFGARFVTREGGRLPAGGQRRRRPDPDRLPAAGAVGPGQIRGLAGRSEHAGRDHRDRAPADPRPHRADAAPLRGGGLDRARRGRRARVTVEGFPELAAAPIIVPGDPSSAAFPLVAGLIVPGSDVTVESVGLNPLRAGLLECLTEMGADIALLNRREEGGEPVADIRARAGPLPAPRSRRAGAANDRRIPDPRGRRGLRPRAHGDARPRRTAGQGKRPPGRHRRGLAACGVKVAVEGDDLIVEGAGGPPAGGALIETRLDHRIAMAFSSSVWPPRSRCGSTTRRRSPPASRLHRADEPARRAKIESAPHSLPRRAGEG